MFISHKYKCIFIHIPKTGGASIHSTLIEHLHPEHIQRGHTSFKDIDGGAPVTIDEYFTFCFVRNPWDRFVGAYNYLLNGGNPHEHPEKGYDKKDRDRFISPHKTFNDFVLMNSRGNKIYTDLMEQQHFKPQYEYILNSDNNIKSINVIGRFENFYKDFDIICKEIGIKTPKLKHLHNRPHEPYATYYSDKTAEIIYNTYKEDVDYFNYSFNS